LRSARSSIGVKPSLANGFVSSPVLISRLPAASKSISPPTWQHRPRVAGVCRIFCSEARSRVASSASLNRDSWL
jgi:hypothetical protein